MKLFQFFRKKNSVFDQKATEYNTTSGPGFSSVRNYINFKNKYIPYLILLVVMGGLGVTLYQVQRQQDTRSRAEFDTIPLHVPTRILIGVLGTELGMRGTWNIYAPEAMFDNGMYRMWYGGQSDNGNDQIHYVDSTDGVNWINRKVVVGIGNPSNMHDGENSDHVNDPSVVKINGTYYMYYTDTHTLDRIALATSTNGTVWTKRQVVIDRNIQYWNSIKLGRPAVIYENGQFKMWFDASCNPRFENFCDPEHKYPPLPDRYIGYATSTDGFNWSVRPEPLKLDNGQWLSAGAVDVKHFNNVYALVHESWTGIFLKTSPDGITWTDKGRWFNKSGGTNDSCGHLTPFIFIRDNKLSALFMGMAISCEWNQNSIGMIRLDGTELDAYSNATPRGSFDIKRCDVLRGWACDTSNAGNPIDVHIYDGPAGAGGVMIGAATANLNRRNDPDYTSIPNHLQVEDGISNNECAGQQNIGWKLTTPNNIKNGLPHTLYAYGINVPPGANPLFNYYYPDGTPNVAPPTYASTTPYVLTCAAPTLTSTPTQPPPTPTRTPTPTPTPVGSTEFIWVEDALPPGAIPGGDNEPFGFMWTDSVPFSGQSSFMTYEYETMHQLYFTNAQPVTINPGDKLFAYGNFFSMDFYYKPVREVMLQWHATDGSGWSHRAYWGTELTGFQPNTGTAMYNAGPLPTMGNWMRLEVPASTVGLEGKSISGMAFTLYGGQGSWDKIGIVKILPTTTLTPTPTRTPTPTNTPIPPTSTPTRTPTPVPPTLTFTPTPTRTPTPVPPTLTPTPTRTPTPIPPTTTPIPKPGDLDGDSDIDIFDYNALLTDFNTTGTPGFVPADIDRDGDVDIFDYNILLTNFGT